MRLDPFAGFCTLTLWELGFANKSVERVFPALDNSPMKELTMRTDNKGLTVKVNLFSLEKDIEDGFTPLHARLWIKGCVTHATTKEELHFNDAGELISILGKWNAEKFKELKAAKRIKDDSQNVS